MGFPMSFHKVITIILTSSILLTGCSFVDRWVYRPDINQGNYVTQDNVEKLKIGQTKEQVAYIMGSPMLTSVFGDDIWYYVFREQPQHGYVHQQTYTLIFGANGLVSDIKTAEIDAESKARTE